MGSAGIYAFEAIDETLPYMPLAARRVLDGLGLKLSLTAWLSLPIQDRWRIVRAGASERVDPTIVSALASAAPPASSISPEPEPDPAAPPLALAKALGPSRPIDPQRWRGLSPLARYALFKYAAKPEKLGLAYDEIAPGVVLTHLTPAGEARMVDVGDKRETARLAVASARVRTTPEVIEAIASGRVAKGDVLAAARIAGILGAKRTSELVPLCHPVRTTRATVELDPDAQKGEVTVRASVEAVDRTGVEMEALVAASIASLTIYDMIKSADRWATIDGLRLDEKRGGKSGDVKRSAERGGT